jgi:hypothetical protein
MVPVELRQWALRHHVSLEALADLSRLLGVNPLPTVDATASEGNVQARVRLAAPAADMMLWRNNVGVLRDDRGVPVRYGLANDTTKLNDRIKSGDLIGWRRLAITPFMVGSTVAQFVSLECKHAAWSYRGDAREEAQQRWAALVAADGGYARFVTRPEDITQ